MTRSRRFIPKPSHKKSKTTVKKRKNEKGRVPDTQKSDHGSISTDAVRLLMAAYKGEVNPLDRFQVRQRANSRHNIGEEHRDKLKKVKTKGESLKGRKKPTLSSSSEEEGPSSFQGAKTAKSNVQQTNATFKKTEKVKQEIFRGGNKTEKTKAQISPQKKGKGKTEQVRLLRPVKLAQADKVVVPQKKKSPYKEATIPDRVTEPKINIVGEKSTPPIKSDQTEIAIRQDDIDQESPKTATGSISPNPAVSEENEQNIQLFTENDPSQNFLLTNDGGVFSDVEQLQNFNSENVMPVPSQLDTCPPLCSADEARHFISAGGTLVPIGCDGENTHHICHSPESQEVDVPQGESDTQAEIKQDLQDCDEKKQHVHEDNLSQHSPVDQCFKEQVDGTTSPEEPAQLVPYSSQQASAVPGTTIDTLNEDNTKITAKLNDDVVIKHMTEPEKINEKNETLIQMPIPKPRKKSKYRRKPRNKTKSDTRIAETQEIQDVMPSDISAVNQIEHEKTSNHAGPNLSDLSAKNESEVDKLDICSLECFDTQKEAELNNANEKTANKELAEFGTYEDEILRAADGEVFYNKDSDEIKDALQGSSNGKKFTTVTEEPQKTKLSPIVEVDDSISDSVVPTESDTDVNDATQTNLNIAAVDTPEAIISDQDVEQQNAIFECDQKQISEYSTSKRQTPYGEIVERSEVPIALMRCNEDQLKDKAENCLANKMIQEYQKRGSIETVDISKLITSLGDQLSMPLDYMIEADNLIPKEGENITEFADQSLAHYDEGKIIDKIVTDSPKHATPSTATEYNSKNSKDSLIERVADQVNVYDSNGDQALKEIKGTSSSDSMQSSIIERTTQNANEIISKGLSNVVEPQDEVPKISSRNSKLAAQKKNKESKNPLQKNIGNSSMSNKLAQNFGRKKRNQKTIKKNMNRSESRSRKHRNHRSPVDDASSQSKKLTNNKKWTSYPKKSDTNKTSPKIKRQNRQHRSELPLTATSTVQDNRGDFTNKKSTHNKNVSSHEQSLGQEFSAGSANTKSNTFPQHGLTELDALKKYFTIPTLPRGIHNRLAQQPTGSSQLSTFNIRFKPQGTRDDVNPVFSATSISVRGITSPLLSASSDLPSQSITNFNKPHFNVSSLLPNNIICAFEQNIEDTNNGPYFVGIGQHPTQNVAQLSAASEVEHNLEHIPHGQNRTLLSDSPVIKSELNTADMNRSPCRQHRSNSCSICPVETPETDKNDRQKLGKSERNSAFQIEDNENSDEHENGLIYPTNLKYTEETKQQFGDAGPGVFQNIGDNQVTAKHQDPEYSWPNKAATNVVSENRPLTDIDHTYKVEPMYPMTRQDSDVQEPSAEKEETKQLEALEYLPEQVPFNIKPGPENEVVCSRNSKRDSQVVAEFDSRHTGRPENNVVQKANVDEDSLVEIKQVDHQLDNKETLITGKEDEHMNCDDAQQTGNRVYVAEALPIDTPAGSHNAKQIRRNSNRASISKDLPINENAQQTRKVSVRTTAAEVAPFNQESGSEDVQQTGDNRVIDAEAFSIYGQPATNEDAHQIGRTPNIVSVAEGLPTDVLASKIYSQQSRRMSNRASINEVLPKSEKAASELTEQARRVTERTAATEITSINVAAGSEDVQQTDNGATEIEAFPIYGQAANDNAHRTRRTSNRTSVVEVLPIQENTTSEITQQARRVSDIAAAAEITPINVAAAPSEGVQQAGYNKVEASPIYGQTFNDDAQRTRRISYGANAAEVSPINESTARKTSKEAFDGKVLPIITGAASEVEQKARRLSNRAAAAEVMQDNEQAYSKDEGIQAVRDNKAAHAETFQSSGAKPSSMNEDTQQTRRTSRKASVSAVLPINQVSSKGVQQRASHRASVVDVFPINERVESQSGKRISGLQPISENKSTNRELVAIEFAERPRQSEAKNIHGVKDDIVNKTLSKEPTLTNASIALVEEQLGALEYHPIKSDDNTKQANANNVSHGIAQNKSVYDTQPHMGESAKLKSTTETNGKETENHTARNGSLMWKTAYNSQIGTIQGTPVTATVSATPGYGGYLRNAGAITGFDDESNNEDFEDAESELFLKRQANSGLMTAEENFRSKPVQNARTAFDIADDRSESEDDTFHNRRNSRKSNITTHGKRTSEQPRKASTFHTDELIDRRKSGRSSQIQLQDRVTNLPTLSVIQQPVSEIVTYQKSSDIIPMPEKNFTSTHDRKLNGVSTELPVSVVTQDQQNFASKDKKVSDVAASTKKPANLAEIPPEILVNPSEHGLEASKPIEINQEQKRSSPKNRKKSRVSSVNRSPPIGGIEQLPCVVKEIPETSQQITKTALHDVKQINVENTTQVAKASEKKMVSVEVQAHESSKIGIETSPNQIINLELTVNINVANSDIDTRHNREYSDKLVGASTNDYHDTAALATHKTKVKSKRKKSTAPIQERTKQETAVVQRGPAAQKGSTDPSYSQRRTSRKPNGTEAIQKTLENCEQFSEPPTSYNSAEGGPESTMSNYESLQPEYIPGQDPRDVDHEDHHHCQHRHHHKHPKSTCHAEEIQQDDAYLGDLHAGKELPDEHMHLRKKHRPTCSKQRRSEMLQSQKASKAKKYSVIQKSDVNYKENHYEIPNVAERITASEEVLKIAAETYPGHYGNTRKSSTQEKECVKDLKSQERDIEPAMPLSSVQRKSKQFSTIHEEDGEEPKESDHIKRRSSRKSIASNKSKRKSYAAALNIKQEMDTYPDYYAQGGYFSPTAHLDDIFINPDEASEEAAHSPEEAAENIERRNSKRRSSSKREFPTQNDKRRKSTREHRQSVLASNRHSTELHNEDFKRKSSVQEKRLSTLNNLYDDTEVRQTSTLNQINPSDDNDKGNICMSDNKQDNALEQARRKSSAVRRSSLLMQEHELGDRRTSMAPKRDSHRGESQDHDAQRSEVLQQGMSSNDNANSIITPNQDNELRRRKSSYGHESKHSNRKISHQSVEPRRSTIHFDQQAEEDLTNKPLQQLRSSFQEKASDARKCSNGIFSDEIQRSEFKIDNDPDKIDITDNHSDKSADKVAQDLYDPCAEASNIKFSEDNIQTSENARKHSSPDFDANKKHRKSSAKSENNKSLYMDPAMYESDDPRRMSLLEEIEPEVKNEETDAPKHRSNSVKPEYEHASQAFANTAASAEPEILASDNEPLTGLPSERRRSSVLKQDDDITRAATNEQTRESPKRRLSVIQEVTNPSSGTIVPPAVEVGDTVTETGGTDTKESGKKKKKKKKKSKKRSKTKLKKAESPTVAQMSETLPLTELGSPETAAISLENAPVADNKSPNTSDESPGEAKSGDLKGSSLWSAVREVAASHIYLAPLFW